jgi:cobalt-zinc-cadmium efflux system membrane fusion protein
MRPDDEDVQLPAQRRSRRALAAVGLAGLVSGALAIGFVLGGRHAAQAPPSVPPAMLAQPGAEGPNPSRTSTAEDPVEVSLTADAIARAGIKTAVAHTGTITASMSVPGTVTSNAYKETKLTALVSGIVRSVSAELGAHVSRGDALAVVFSNDLADAQMKYLSAHAMLGADHEKLVRTEKLVQIGAASRQELEEIAAVHTAHEAEVAAARQRLLLLGLSPEGVAALRQATNVVSEITVTAPNSGTVIARSVNPGQVLAVGQEMFVVADLGTVWVIGDLYEKDFPSVRVGSEATVVVPPSGRQIRGRVAYIDPRVDQGSRTAKVRVEVPNGDGSLRLGMFLDVKLSTSERVTGIFVPRTAVQSIGERNVVYVLTEGEGGRFAERPVKLGAPTGDVVELIAGVKIGERVVTDGSFFVRAEAARGR